MSQKRLPFGLIPNGVEVVLFVGFPACMPGESWPRSGQGKDNTKDNTPAQTHMAFRRRVPGHMIRRPDGAVPLHARPIFYGGLLFWQAHVLFVAARRLPVGNRKG